MDVSFNSAKRADALRDRGLDVADAGTVFEGRTVNRPGRPADCGEDRCITAGHLDGRCVVLVWTPRGDSGRIVSMRHAHAREEAAWFS